MSVKFAPSDNIIEEVDETSDELSKEDENRFNNLCDSVNNCMVLVQNSHFELMEFKSLLLLENIAPSLLVKLSLITGLVFRSISDLYNPLGELIRLVKVYSEPWEKKSQALRKLHKDYEVKAGQLNVALKRLAIQNEETRRVRKKEILQNWELLFSRAQMSRNHGRRWKYRMFEFKLKAQKGIDNLQDYFQDLLDEDDGLRPKIQRESDDHATGLSGRKSIAAESTKFQDDVTVKDIDEGDDEYQESFEEKEEADSVEPIETVDVSVGTTDANYSQTLVMRVYNPKGLEMFDNLRCRVVYGDRIYETGYLDKSQATKEEEDRIEMESNADNLEVGGADKGKTKKGLMGRRKNKQKDQTKSVEQIRKEQAEKRLRYLARSEEVKIPVPVEVTAGINKNSLYQSVKFIVFVDDKSQAKICQATIDLEELQAMDIQTFKEEVYKGDLVTPPTTANGRPFANLEPMTFPLYEYEEQLDVSESPAPMGQVPISCFWSRREDQAVFHRSIETESITRVVEQLTGINLDLISKEELTREKIDEGVSPRLATPPPVTISLSDYEATVSRYEELVFSMREKYEQQLLDMSTAMEAAREVAAPRPSSAYHKDCASSPIFPYRSSPGTRRIAKSGTRHIRTEIAEKPKSSKSRDTLSTSGPDDQEELIYVSPDFKESPDDQYCRTRDNAMPRLVDNMSSNFLQRVSIYSELSNQHREELSTKVRVEVSKAIEEKLKDLYKLHEDLTEEDVATALEEMCFPAVFMPMANSSGTVYNPRAHQYFHPSSLRNLRLSQPPSIFKLPPIKQNQMSILNLFEIGNEIHIRRIEKGNFNIGAIKKTSQRIPENTVQRETQVVPQDTV